MDVIKTESYGIHFYLNLRYKLERVFLEGGFSKVQPNMISKVISLAQKNGHHIFPIVTTRLLFDALKKCVYDGRQEPFKRHRQVKEKNTSSIEEQNKT